LAAPATPYLTLKDQIATSESSQGKLSKLDPKPSDDFLGGKPMLRARRLQFALAIMLVAAALAIASAQAQTYTYSVLYSFTGSPDGAYPPSGYLAREAQGNLYGTTQGGGDLSCNAGFGCGTVFKVDTTGKETLLYSFSGTAGDGTTPSAGLVRDAQGSLYGTTAEGGAYQDGTVFKLDTTGKESVLYSFTGTGGDGVDLRAGLVRDVQGNLYGTTYKGGAYGYGTVFKVDTTGKETVLYSFTGIGGDGAFPVSGLVPDSQGNLYGTTSLSGAYGYGTVFKVDTTGKETVLYSFTGTGGDGAGPYGDLVLDAQGNLYGTTFGGGDPACNGIYGACGTVFKLDTTGKETVLYSFTGIGGGNRTVGDGAYPYAGLVRDAQGNLYGTTYYGGERACNDMYGGCGTVFKLDTAGHETVLYSFIGTGGDGAYPAAGLVRDAQGNLYGTTGNGGDLICNAGGGCGTVFKLTPAPPAPQQFVTVTPCRVVDTRNPDGEFGGPPIAGGTYRNFAIPDNQNCRIPNTAAAYSLNVTVVPPGPLGYLTIWPTGEDRPVVSTMNSLDGRIKANAVIVPAGTQGAVSVYVTNSTDVVLDIDGYFAPTSGSTFYALPPCRVADTRKSTFPPGLGVPHLSGGVARDFPVLNAAACNIPSSAQAYSLNFTAVPYPALGAPLGYLELWPTGQQPANPVSTLNNLTGTIVANAAIVPAGTGGDITAYASNDTDLVIDINGYFAPAGQNGLSLYPAVPCRVIDTRKIGNGQPFSGTLSPPVDVVDSVCGPPSTAQAYVFNATVVPSGGLGYLTLWPDGQGQPVVSTLNAIDGAITSNMAIVPTNNGKVDAYASGITQLILDISSYFAP
jgi:uncharacterized repeat protein (TIGR03803 family)